MQSKQQDIFIKIVPTDGKVMIEWKYSILVKKEEAGLMSCYIPYFKIAFSADDEAEMKKKSKDLTFLYFDYFMNEDKNGLKKLAIDLTKLGFNPVNDRMTTLRELFNNRPVKTKLKSGKNDTIEHFHFAEELEGSLDVAY
ncbi:MAG: hypothetical protein WAT19_05815 [Ferruginibacter sp.]